MSWCPGVEVVAESAAEGEASDAISDDVAAGTEAGRSGDGHRPHGGGPPKIITVNPSRRLVNIETHPHSRILGDSSSADLQVVGRHSQAWHLSDLDFLHRGRGLAVTSAFAGGWAGRGPRMQLPPGIIPAVDCPTTLGSHGWPSVSGAGSDTRALGRTWHHVERPRGAPPPGSFCAITGAIGRPELAWGTATLELAVSVPSCRRSVRG